MANPTQEFEKNVPANHAATKRLDCLKKYSRSAFQEKPTYFRFFGLLGSREVWLMPMDAKTLADVATLCRFIKQKLGSDASLRLTTLADMMLIEAERPFDPPKQARPVKSDAP